MTLRCSQCNKPQIVFSEKKPSTQILTKFKKHSADLLFICGRMVLELIANTKDMKT